MLYKKAEGGTYVREGVAYFNKREMNMATYISQF